MEIEHCPAIKEISQKFQLSRTAALKGSGAVFESFGKNVAAHAAAPLQQQPDSSSSFPLRDLSIFS